MQQVVALELAGLGQRVDERESRARSLHHRHRRRAVERHDRRGLHPLEQLVEAHDLRPVGVLGARRLTVQRRDRRLQRERARALTQTFLDEGQRLRDQRLVPAAAVLIFQQDEVAGVVQARLAPRVVQQRQREQGRGLRGRIGRHQPTHQPREANGLRAEIGAHERLAARGRIALGEDQIHHRQHRVEPRGHVDRVRHRVRNARVPDLGLRPHQALGHRRRRDEKHPRDLVRLEPAQRAQRERHLGLEGERGMTAGEDQSQLIVGDRVRIERRRLDRGDRFVGSICLHLLREADAAPNAVDGLVSGRLDDPRTWIIGNAGGRPLIDGRGERLLRRLLGDVEIADEPDERRDDPAPIRAIDGVHGRVGRRKIDHER